MFLRLLFAIAVIVALFTAWHKIKKTPPEQRKSVTIKVVVAIIIIVVLIGAMTGRVHWLGAIAAALVPFARFGMRYGLQLSQFWMSRSGGNATFSTPYFRVIFNVKSGTVQGEIIKGLYEGVQIETLTEQQIDELIVYYQQHDKKSLYLMKAIKQRKGFGDLGGQGARHQGADQSVAAPARDQALEILGLSGNPTRKEIVHAHRRLINKLHPDRGGNDFLAAQVNQARDELLKSMP